MISSTNLAVCGAIQGILSKEWADITKASIAEAVLTLTKLEEDQRSPSDCLQTPSLWLTLAALCLLQDEHVERLSSTQWANPRGAVNKVTTTRLHMISSWARKSETFFIIFFTSWLLFSCFFPFLNIFTSLSLSLSLSLSAFELTFIYAVPLQWNLIIWSLNREKFMFQFSSNVKKK